MTNLKFRSSRIRKLYKTTEETVCAVKITEEEYNAFVKDMFDLSEADFFSKYYFNKVTVIAHGDTVSVPVKIMESVIDKVELNKDRTSYRCFTGDHTKCITHSTVIIHEDIRSSWTCLMGVMRFPKYLILLKIPNDEII